LDEAKIIGRRGGGVVKAGKKGHKKGTSSKDFWHSKKVTRRGGSSGKNLPNCMESYHEVKGGEATEKCVERRGVEEPFESITEKIGVVRGWEVLFF